MKKIILIITSLLLIVLISVSIYFYNSINNKYPQSEKINLELNDQIRYKNSDIKAISYEVLNFNQFIERSKNKIDSTDYTKYFDTNDLNFVLVTVEVMNPLESVISPSLVNIVIEANKYSNGIDSTAFVALNGDISLLVPKLNSGEKKTIILPYMLMKNKYLSSNNKQDAKFQLVLALYPQKICYELNY